MIKKDKPIINKELCAEIRKLPCCICNGMPSVPHHSYRRKPQLDVPENLFPMCIRCHTVLHGANNKEQFKKLCKDNYKDFNYWWNKLNGGWALLQEIREKYNKTGYTN